MKSRYTLHTKSPRSLISDSPGSRTVSTKALVFWTSQSKLFCLIGLYKTEMFSGKHGLTFYPCLMVCDDRWLNGDNVWFLLGQQYHNVDFQSKCLHYWVHGKLKSSIIVLLLYFFFISSSLLRDQRTFQVKSPSCWAEIYFIRKHSFTEIFKAAEIADF